MSKRMPGRRVWRASLLLVFLIAQSRITVGADKLEFAPVEIQFVEKLEQVQGVWDLTAGKPGFGGTKMAIEGTKVQWHYWSDVGDLRKIEGEAEISEGAILLKENGRKKPHSRWQLVEVDGERYLMSLGAIRTKEGTWVWRAPQMLHKMFNLNGTFIKAP